MDGSIRSSLNTQVRVRVPSSSWDNQQEVTLLVSPAICLVYNSIQRIKEVAHVYLLPLKRTGKHHDGDRGVQLHRGSTQGKVNAEDNLHTSRKVKDEDELSLSDLVGLKLIIIMSI